MKKCHRPVKSATSAITVNLQAASGSSADQIIQDAHQRFQAEFDEMNARVNSDIARTRERMGMGVRRTSGHIV